jgi:hypothetical protein
LPRGIRPSIPRGEDFDQDSYLLKIPLNFEQIRLPKLPLG